MKELLIKYYNVNENIIEENSRCLFIKNNKKYLFLPFERSEEEFSELFSLNEELMNKHIPTSLFILNKQNNYITIEDNLKYILLEMPLENQEYNVLDMMKFHNQLVISSKKSILYRNKWAELWSKKIDYFEYQVRELGRDKPIILNSFSYYSGLAEIAISYINSTIKKHQPTISEKITLQRKRINFPNLSCDYFNPLNYIIDLEVRDIASYFKSLFFESKENLKIEINAYFKNKKLSLYGYQLLYARLIYPSFYFDIYESVMEGKKEEKELLNIINQVDDYEIFLKEMFYLLRNFAPIDPIEWLIKES